MQFRRGMLLIVYLPISNLRNVKLGKRDKELPVFLPLKLNDMFSALDGTNIQQLRGRPFPLLDSDTIRSLLNSVGIPDNLTVLYLSVRIFK